MALEARDGYPLEATYHPPRGDAPGPTGGRGGRERAGEPGAAHGSVLVAPAMAVRRDFYEDYAAWLAGRGFAVLTLDVRGVGGSRPPDLSELEDDLVDVGRNDLPAGLDWLEAGHPRAPLQCVAHSLGGQLLGVLPDPGRLRSALLVAAASGHWRLWPRPNRWKLAALWWVLIPLLTAIRGHFPSRWAGLGEDLPPGIARCWARWGRHRDYVVDASGRPLRAGFRAFRGRLRAYSFTDDPMAPRRAVEELLRWYRTADPEHLRIAPADVGRSEIGHFGFFREQSRGDLWPESAAWLAEEEK